MDPLVLGLDVGTSSVKATAFTPAGDVVATGRATTPWDAAGTQTAASGLLDAALDALGQVAESVVGREVAGLGVTSMGESGILLDRSGSPVGPVVAWHDTRDVAELADLDRVLGREFAARTGLPMRQQWSLTTHRWLLDNVPETDGGVVRLNAAEWVVHALGGDQASEHSLASRTGWLDVAERRWWPDALAWSGVHPSLLPDLVDAGTALGTVDHPAVPGLRGAVLTVAGHDHQAAAIGAGAAGPGDELDSCGTAEALVRSVPPGLPGDVVAALAEAGITVGWHAMPGRWCLLAGTQGGLVLQRVLAMLGLDRTDLPALDAAAEALTVADLQGGPQVRIHEGGVTDLLGAAGGLSPAHLWRAVVEAVTDEAEVLHEAMSAVTGPHRRLVVTGGWSHSSAVLAAKQRRFGELVHPRTADAGTWGAALLGGLAAGTYAHPDRFPVLDEALPTGEPSTPPREQP